MDNPTPPLILDSNRNVVCPECGTLVKCGTSGLANFEKRHRGTITCKAAKENLKRNKGKKDGSILSFLKPRPTAVPSTVSDSTPIHSHRLAPATEDDPFISPSLLGAEDHVSTSKVPKHIPTPIMSSFVKQFHTLVKCLPASIPEALETNKLAIFGSDPKAFDDPAASADELWEMGLNNVLKSALGWGLEGDMDAIIQRGKWGLDGLLDFVIYFVEERGVSEGKFEGKLGRLMEKLEKKSVVGSMCDTDKTNLTTLPVDFNNLFPTTQASPEPNYFPIGFDEEEIIDVDAFKYEDPIKQPNKSVTACRGHTVIFPNGKSPHTAYPFALHETLVLPWDYIVKNGTMTLFARSCTGLSEGEMEKCQPCRRLTKNTSLETIFTRIADGIHENAGFAYHGFSGLQELLRRKNRQIEFYRLRGLNQARKLLAKATSLDDQKRLLMAIASGKVNRIDRLLSIGIKQKMGARGLRMLYNKAAEGYYNPKSFTEEEDMKAILMWRLGGNRLAEINHHANNSPSTTYLRTRSTVPPIIPSHNKPTVEQVQTNVKATFNGLFEVINSQNPGSKFVHAVLMFDELATEKRVRWDPKTNYFLGICREHADKTSTEFINEEDMEELFQNLDNGKVHYAGEVRKFQFASTELISIYGLGNGWRPWCSLQR
jgi:hypothetical protein